MGLLRLVFWLALIGAAYWVVRRWWRGKTATTRKAPTPLAAEPMVRCAHCGVHVPRLNALGDAEGHRWYCSAEHHRLHHAPGD